MKANVLLILAYLISGLQTTSAQIPQTLTYQSELLNANGTPVADGNYDLTFRLYNVVTGGSALWTEQQQILVVNGIFSAILGKVSPLSIPFDKQYWLGVTIGGDSELAPRAQLTSTPYSLMARSIIDGAVTNSKIADQTIDITKLSFEPVTFDQTGGIAFNGNQIINSSGQWVGDPSGLQGPKGDKPAHEWSGTSLRFENPDGSFGSFVDLKGPPGPPGRDGLPGPAVSTSAVCRNQAHPGDRCSHVCAGTVVVDMNSATNCQVTSDTGSCYASAFGSRAQCCVCSP